MSGLFLGLLGPFFASVDDGPSPEFQTQRAKALLIFLATESALGTGAHAHGREALMELLWDELPLESARVNLRQTLYLLRQAVDDLPFAQSQGGVPLLLTDRHRARLNPDFPLHTDAAKFLEHLDGPRDAWPEAVALYRGDFLADFYLADAGGFETWAASRRAAFRRQILDALDTLTTERMQEGAFDEAEQLARRHLEIDNLRESAYRQLMEVYAWTGRQAEALRLYQRCRQVLEAELDTAPDAATSELHDAIRENRLGPPPGADEVRSISGAPAEKVAPPNPFRGLSAFREEDADHFFGRESVTQRLLEAVERLPLVAVIGPSGSGKSSVLFAGLAARARSDRSLAIVAFRPGSNPFQALAASLLPLLEPRMGETDRLVEARKLASALKEGELPLSDVLSRIVNKDPEYECALLLVDQFEELFTLCSSRAMRECFLDLLLEAIVARDSGAAAGTSVVLALRADFLGQALGYRPLADALQDADLKLGPMTPQELARAIEKPAQRQGVAFADGLVERILDDVGREPGHLPLLQFALTALWDKQEEGRLTHAAYEAIGRVQGAVARYAEDVFGQLSASEKEQARKLLLQTIRPGAQTEDTRRLALRGELGEEEWALAQRLAGARLVVLGRDPAGRQTVELVHEALIHGWDRLHAWLEEDRAFRAWQERLRAALRQWQTSGRDEGALLRGVPLAEAQGWLGERAHRLSEEESAYIGASLRRRDARDAEREREREARERTRRRITQGIAAGFMIALLLALLAAIQWRQAVRARDRAETATSLQLAAVGDNLAGEQLDVAALLSVEAYRRADTFEGRNSLLNALTESPYLIAYLHGHEADVRAVAFSPDGRTLATGAADGAIHLWDTDSARPLGPTLTGHSIIVRSLAFSPDGRTLASSSVDGTIRFWEVAQGGDGDGSDRRGIYARDSDTLGRENAGPPVVTAIMTVEVDSAAGLAYSPDGRVLAIVEGDYVILRDGNEESGSFGRALEPPLAGAGAKLVSVAFSPEGDLLAAGDAEGTIIFWDAVGERLRSFTDVHGGSIAALAFSPDGKLLASASSDGTVRLWDVGTGGPAAPALAGHSDWVTGVAFAEGGQSLLSSGRDGRILLWDISRIAEGEFDQQPSSTALDKHGEPVWSVAVDSEGTLVATGGAQPRAALWDLARIHPLARALNGHRKGFPVTGVSFSPDGKRLASASLDSTILMWDVDRDSPSLGKPLYDIRDVHSQWVTFSPGGTVLASAARGHKILLWDLSGRPEVFLELVGHKQLVKSADFSPNGRLLASSSDDRTVIVWDVDRNSPSFGRQLFSSGDLGFVSREVIFSADGETLLVGSHDSRILRWRVSGFVQNDNRQGQRLPPLSGHTASIQALDRSSDGQTVVSISSDGTVRMWNLASGLSVGDPLPLVSWIDETLDAAFSPDGRTLALTESVDPDQRVHLLDVRSRQSYDRVLIGHRNGVFSVAFNPEGGVLASTGHYPTQILLWDVDPESWAERACRLANRNLTQEEWRRYFGEEAYRATCPELPIPSNG